MLKPVELNRIPGTRVNLTCAVQCGQVVTSLFTLSNKDCSIEHVQAPGPEKESMLVLIRLSLYKLEMLKEKRARPRNYEGERVQNEIDEKLVKQ